MLKLIVIATAVPVVLITNVVTWPKIILRDLIVALQIFDPDIFRIKHSRNLAPANLCQSKVMDQNN